MSLLKGLHCRFSLSPGVGVLSYCLKGLSSLLLAGNSGNRDTALQEMLLFSFLLVGSAQNTQQTHQAEKRNTSHGSMSSYPPYAFSCSLVPLFFSEAVVHIHTKAQTCRAIPNRGVLPDRQGGVVFSRGILRPTPMARTASR